MGDACATNSALSYGGIGEVKERVAWPSFIMHLELRIAANSTQNVAKALDFRPDSHQTLSWFWGRSNGRDFELGSGEIRSFGELSVRVLR